MIVLLLEGMAMGAVLTAFVAKTPQSMLPRLWTAYILQLLATLAAIRVNL